MGITAGLLTARAVAWLELVRFLRRRETLWLLSVLVAPSLLLGASPLDVPPLPLGHMMRLLACLAIVPITYYLAVRAAASELDTGSYVLLRQGPASLAATHLGKAVAVAIQALWLLATCLLVPLALLATGGPGPGETLVDPLLVLAYALGFVPEGMLVAFVQRGSSRTAYAAMRVATVARIVLPFAVVQATLPAALKAEGIHVLHVVEAWMVVGAGASDMASSWLADVRPDRTFLWCQLATTVPYVVLLPRRP